MGFAEGVSPGNKGHRLIVIHRHAGKGLADVFGRRKGVGVAIGPFRIHIDETHLHCGQGVCQVTVTAVAFVAEPLGFLTPVDIFFWFPHIFPATGESKGFKSHGLDGAITGEDHEIRPGNLLAILLLERPEQASGLVQAGIIGPTVEGGKTLGTR